MNLHIPSPPVFVPERSLTLFSVLADGRRVRCAVGNPVLAILGGLRVDSEDEQIGAWGRCREQILALAGRLLEQGRGDGGGLFICPEDMVLTAASA
jgi:hypothetical protein